MPIYNISLPTVSITNIFMPPSNIQSQPISNDNNVVPNDVALPDVATQDNAFSFVQNVLQTLQDVTAAATPTDATTATTASTLNPIGALQVFLYDLNQALTTTPQAQAPITVDAGAMATLPSVDTVDAAATTTEPSIDAGAMATLPSVDTVDIATTTTETSLETGTTTLPSEIKAAYSDPMTNLQNLISSLDNGSNQSITLQTDFSNVIQSIGGSPSSVNLQDFLKQLATNVSNVDALQNNLGNLFVATA